MTIETAAGYSYSVTLMHTPAAPLTFPLGYRSHPVALRRPTRRSTKAISLILLFLDGRYDHITMPKRVGQLETHSRFTAPRPKQTPIYQYLIVLGTTRGIILSFYGILIPMKKRIFDDEG